MFRFTIRDVLWLMVAAGLMVAWYLDHQRMFKTIAELESELEGFRVRRESRQVLYDLDHPDKSKIRVPPAE